MGKTPRKPPPSLSLTTTLANTSTTIMLCEDMMIGILNKLPYKTLIRLCTVSKKWLDMISNPKRPNSCYSLRLKSYGTLIGFFYNRKMLLHGSSHRYGLSWVPLSLTSNPTSTSGVTGPYNPLPVLPELNVDVRTLTIDASSNGSLLGHHKPYRYFVTNPITQQVLRLPKISSELRLSAKEAHISVGFYCPVVSEPFSVAHFTVVLGHLISISAMELRILSSNHHDQSLMFQWRRLRLEVINKPKPAIINIGMPINITSIHARPAVVQDSVFYWIVNSMMLSIIVAFDVSRLQYWVMDLPSIDYNINRHVPIFVHNEILCSYGNRLFCGYGSHKKKAILVYMYEGNPYKDEGSWVLNYTVPLHVLARSRNGDGEMVFLKAFHPSNHRIFFFIHNTMLMSYDDAQGQCSVVDSHADYRWSRTQTFISYELSPWPRPLPCLPWDGHRENLH